MTDLNSFIQETARSMGAAEPAVRSATGGIFRMIQSRVAAGDFQSLLAKVPQVSEVMSDAPAAAGEQAASGGLGGMLSKAVPGLASAAGIPGLLKQSGLDLSQAGGLVSALLGFLKQQAGADLVSRLASQVPELKSLSN